VFTVLDAILEILNVIEDIGMVLKDTSISLVGRLSMIRLKLYSIILSLSRLGYKHEYVNHSEREWVRGEYHINNCENRASILRPWLSIHRGICKDNLKLYLAAFKTCRRSRTINPIQSITEIIKTKFI
jgi:hypothetical protein